MNWEPSAANVQQNADDHPLTPTRTPRSAKFDSSIFATPTFDSAFSGAQPVWDSPNPNSFACTVPPSGPGQYVTQGGRALPPGQNTNSQVAFNAFRQSQSPHLNLPPVSPAQQLHSSPGFEQGSWGIPQRQSFQSQIRTPPPTRSGERRRRQQASNMTDGRRVSTPGAMRPPETPNRRVQASPHLFPSLQFSPELSQFGGSGPLTAPVMPPRGLFWDDDSAFFSSTFDDSFNPDATPNANLFMQSPSSSQIQQVVPPLQQPFDLRHVSSPLGPASSPSHFDGGAFPAPFTASPRVITSRPDDPAQYLSSPARRFEHVPKSAPLTTAQRRTDKEAYHHQNQESRREREERARRSKSKKDMSSSMLKAPLDPSTPLSVGRARPSVKRSNTHSGSSNETAHLRRQSQVSFSDTVTIAEEGSQGVSGGGRSSPLKRPYDGNLTEIERPASRNRVSWSLTVDADGRARPVAKPMTETVMEDDGASVTSSQPSDDDAFDLAQSRNTSFAFSHGVPPVAQSSFSGINETQHSKSSSYSSGFGSSNSALPSSRTSSVKAGINSGYNGYRGGRAENLASVQRSVSPSTQSVGDAQQALRAMKRDREVGPGRLATSRSQTNLQPSTFNSSPPVQQSEYDFYGHNISPTTITDPDLATPSTDRDSQISESTRCVCSGSQFVGNTMIQCESCNKWLHMKCVGLSEAPQVYICIYCAQTPMRHGRIREPRNNAALPAGSPLAHKSLRHR